MLQIELGSIAAEDGRIREGDQILQVSACTFPSSITNNIVLMEFKVVYESRDT